MAKRKLKSIDDIDFLPGIDIKHNRRKHTTPSLRFIKDTESGVVELLRNEIWMHFLDGMSVRKIGELPEINLSKSVVDRHIQICKKMYDEWVTKNGLSLHGDPANRLEDTIAALDEDLIEIRELCKDAKDNDDVRGYTQLKTLETAIRKEKGKYMGIEPPKQVNVELTSAEVTRETMEKMFPTDDGDMSGDDSEVEGDVEQ